MRTSVIFLLARQCIEQINYTSIPLQREALVYATAPPYLYKQSHLPLRIDFFFLTPFPCTDGPEILHARHKSVRLKIPRSAPPSAHAFARSPTKTAKRPKMRVGSGVFEPFHSAHGPADDGWWSLEDLTFRRRIQRCAFRALGSKTRGVTI
jgi:hypothetical protein